jgi:fumarate reductase subunit D
MKTFLPPFAGFVVFAVIVLLQSIVFPIHLGDMGKGNLHAFMACFYYCWPLYFITALLTQGLIVLPIWEAAHSWSMVWKDATVTAAALICALFAGAIAYIIWDQQTGFLHLADMAILMLLIQLAYWIINFFVLSFITGHPIKLKPKHKTTTEE